MKMLTAHLENFRSTQDLSEDFSTDGTHALVGPPGSGKSTVFAGYLFSLFGDPGPDQELLDLRYDKAAEGSEVVADYTWTHNGVHYRTRRTLRRGRRQGKPMEKAAAQMWRDGVEIDNMTPTLMTAEVTKILGMGARGLTGSSLIRQGEVDKLTTAAPTEVQRLVEEHTGISELTKARDAARKEATEARRVADALPGSLPEVHDAVDAADLAQQDADRLDAAAETVRANATRARENWEHAHTRATSLQEAAAAAQATRERIIAAETTLESAIDAEQRALSEATETGIGDTVEPGAVEDTWRRLSQQRTVVADAGNALLAAHRTAGITSSEADSAAQAVGQAHDERTRLLAEQQTIAAELEETTTRGHQQRGMEAAAAAEVARLDKAIATLTGMAGKNAHCPTCQQSLDDANTLVEELQTQRRRAQAAMSAAKAALTDLSEAVAALNERTRAVQSSLEQVAALGREAESAASRAQAAQAAEVTALSACGALLPEPASGYSATVEALRTLKADIDNQLSRVGEQRSAVRQLTRCRELTASARRRLADVVGEAVAAPDPQAVAEALAAATQLRVTADALAEESAAATSGAQVALMGAAQLRSAAEVAQRQWDRKQTAVRAAEIADTTAQTLAAYRQDLIGDFCDGISAAATELLAQFGGEHVAFRLDSEFVPRVELADGRLRKTSSLSGGEKARAGLAFRLGISMQITDGGLPAQLIGDEITSYLDEDGRRQILDVISALFTTPILVSHTNEILDHASVVHQLWRSPMGTTEVLPSDLAS